MVECYHLVALGTNSNTHLFWRKTSTNIHVYQCPYSQSKTELNNIKKYIILSSFGEIIDFVVYVLTIKPIIKLLFSSPELKAQVSFSDHLLSFVCLSVRLSVPVCKLFTFSSSSPEPLYQF